MADISSLAGRGGERLGEGMAGIRRQQAGVRHHGEVETSPGAIASSNSRTVLRLTALLIQEAIIEV